MVEIDKNGFGKAGSGPNGSLVKPKMVSNGHERTRLGDRTGLVVAH